MIKGWSVGKKGLINNPYFSFRLVPRLKDNYYYCGNFTWPIYYYDINCFLVDDYD